MKKTIILSAVLSLFSMMIFSSCLTSQPKTAEKTAAGGVQQVKPVIFQAMKYTKEEGGTIKPIANRTDANGEIVTGWNNKGHVLEWEVNVEVAGSYKIVFRYCTGRTWNVHRDLAIDGKVPAPEFQKITFLPTGGFARDNNDWVNFTIVDAKGAPVMVNLTAGKHILRMNNLGGDDGDGACNLDTIGFLPKETDPNVLGKVAPKK